jgi:protein phosphatase
MVEENDESILAMKQKLSVDFGAATDIGRVRNDNQDTHGIFPSEVNADIDPRGRLFVVADGMGGHRGGKFASELAVKTIGELYTLASSNEVALNLVAAIQSANEAVYSASMNDLALRGMGTTCVVVVVKQEKVCVAHIGDSRVYRLTKEAIEQVTEDHTLVADMQRRGVLTAEEAKTHPERSVLYRALGTQKSVDVDVQPEHIIRSEEWYVLCSDGLSNMVEDAEIQKIVVANNPQHACDKLVSLANEHGGYDNITVVVVHVTAP